MADGTLCEECQGKRQKKDTWYQKGWRPLCAISYILINLFDFVVMPAVYEHKQLSPMEAVELSMKFEGNELQAYQSIQVQRTWDPLTLKGGAFFHIAFGALLTGAAVTRGLEKTARERS